MILLHTNKLTVMCLMCFTFLIGCGSAAHAQEGSNFAADGNIVESPNADKRRRGRRSPRRGRGPVVTTPTPSPEVVVTANHPDPRTLEVVESGGCNSFGPNCATYTLFTDGRFEVSRNQDTNSGLVFFGEPSQSGDGAQSENIESRGRLDAGLLDSWLQQLALEDFSTLRSQLGAGTCMSCVDGTDLTYTIFRQVNGADQNEVFSTVFYNLNSTQPTIAMMVGLYDTLMGSNQPQIVSR